MPKSLLEMCTFDHAGREKVYRAYGVGYADVLTTLAENGGEVYDKSGLAVAKLQSMCHTVKCHDMTGSALNSTCQRLEAGGWLEIEKGTKRTYRIKLLHQPPTDVIDWMADAEMAATRVVSNGQAPSPPPVAEMPEPEPELPTAAALVDEDAIARRITQRVMAAVEDDELGGRAGRIGARLEANLPPLVQEAATAAVVNTFDQMFAGMGYSRGASEAQLAEWEAERHAFESQVASLQSTIESQAAEVRNLNAALDMIGEREADRLLHSNDGTVSSKVSLTVNQVHEMFRPLARIALDQGFTIKNCRGSGHLQWRAPANKGGKCTYSSKTPSNPSEPRIMRRWLTQIGLDLTGLEGRVS